jgi:hypothetical protein
MEGQLAEILARLKIIEEDLQRVRQDNPEAVEQVTRRLESLEETVKYDVSL